ncbi:Insulin receptor 2, partial [Gryllus bimaculatus]
GACAAGGVLWLRGSRRRRLRHLFATVNPDYGQLAGGAGPGPPLYDESWEVAPERVQVLRELGRGSFGRVAEALLLPEGGAHPEGQPAVRCAAKAVAAASGRARAEALNEAAAMK